MTNFKKVLMASTFAAAMLFAPAYASANTNVNNNTPQQPTIGQMYHTLQNTRTSVSNTQPGTPSTTTQFPQYPVQKQMQLGSYHNHVSKNTLRIMKNHHFTKVYLQGNGSGNSKQDMRASKLARHSVYFHKMFLKYAPEYYENEYPSHNMNKQLQTSWKILQHYSKQSKTYRQGWYAINSNPIKRLRHNKAYRKGFRDSVIFKWGSKAPIRSFFKGFMAFGKIKD